MSMKDPTYGPDAFLIAHDVVRHIGQNLAIQFQIEGDTWDRETMQKHVNSRAAIIHVQNLLLNSGEAAAEAKEAE